MKLIERNKNIDTLRGISIFFVVIYHLKIEILNYTLFTGGYLGVDIFFLISGYLITSILFLNSNDKQFEYTKFLKKRFLRIFPTYIILIFVTLIFGFIVLTQNQLVELANSAFASILFISNIHYWNVLNDYFFTNIDNKNSLALLHTWSLSIEIQYYFFISLIFILIKKINLNPKIFLIIIGILSFLITLVLSSIEPQINFFGFQSRLWEFILGSLIFFYKDKINIKINHILKYIIYLIIFTFVVQLKETTPSLITFIFLIFVSILILNKNKLKENIDDKFFNFFGLISYSLYIWHYPIISFSELIFFEINILAKLFIFLLSVFISFISFKLIEKKLNYNSFKNFFIVFFLFFVCLALITSIIKNDGFPKRLTFNKVYNNDLDIPQKDKDRYCYILKLYCTNLNSNYGNEYSYESIYDNNLLIMGNSHSILAYRGFIWNTDKELYKNLNFNNFHIQIHCFSEDIFYEKRDKCKGFLDFDEQTKFSKGLIDFKNSKYILLITRWTEEDLIALPNVIEFLKSQNKKIIIFSSITDISKKNNFNDKSLTFIEKNHIKQNYEFRNYLYLNKHLPTTEELVEMEKLYYQNKSKYSKLINDQLKILSRKLDIQYFDLNKFICDDVVKRCKVVTDQGKHIMEDNTGHLTLSASQYLFKIIHKEFMDIIDDKNF